MGNSKCTGSSTASSGEGVQYQRVGKVICYLLSGLEGLLLFMNITIDAWMREKIVGY